MAADGRLLDENHRQDKLALPLPVGRPVQRQAHIQVGDHFRQRAVERARRITQDLCVLDHRMKPVVDIVGNDLLPQRPSIYLFVALQMLRYRQQKQQRRGRDDPRCERRQPLVGIAQLKTAALFAVFSAPDIGCYDGWGVYFPRVSLGSVELRMTGVPLEWLEVLGNGNLGAAFLEVDRRPGALEEA